MQTNSTEQLIPQFNILYSAETLQDKVKSLGATINLDLHEEIFSQPIFIGVLTGSFMFFGDLMKEISLDCEVDFVEAKSYTVENKKGQFVITKEPTRNVEGRNIVLVEDFIDSGETIRKLKHYFTTVLKAKKVVVVSLLARKRLLLDLPSFEYYVGDYVDNEAWIVGYGLDDSGKLRNLKEIFIKA